MAVLPALVVRFALALWVGGTLVVVLTAPVLFRGLPSRDAAGRLFDEVLRRFEAVKHVLSLALVVALFAQIEAAGGIPPGGTAAGIAIFLAVASNVYLAMVVRPRIGYFRQKVGDFDAAGPADPWKRRFDRLHRRSVRVLVLGWIAAAAALALTA